MERLIRIVQSRRATNEAVFEFSRNWVGTELRDIDTKVELSTPMTDEELRGLYSDGSPVLELYYEGDKVVGVRKVGTWNRPVRTIIP